MKTTTPKLLLLASVLSLATAQYTGGAGSAYGIPSSGYGSPNYGGSAGLGGLSTSGFSPSGSSFGGSAGLSPLTAASAYGPASAGVGGFGTSGASGLDGSTGIAGPSSSTTGAAGATGNPNSRIFGLLTGGGLFGGRGRGGGLLSNLFGGNRFNQNSVAYPVPYPGYGYGGYGGGFYG